MSMKFLELELMFLDGGCWSLRCLLRGSPEKLTVLLQWIQQRLFPSFLDLSHSLFPGSFSLDRSNLPSCEMLG